MISIIQILLHFHSLKYQAPCKSNTNIFEVAPNLLLRITNLSSFVTSILFSHTSFTSSLWRQLICLMSVQIIAPKNVCLLAGIFILLFCQRIVIMLNSVLLLWSDTFSLYITLRQSNIRSTTISSNKGFFTESTLLKYMECQLSVALSRIR